ncbi:MAG: hypothetical protein ACP6IY_22395, partial [Promethearchaeia archaeon]
YADWKDKVSDIRKNLRFFYNFYSSENTFKERFIRIYSKFLLSVYTLFHDNEHSVSEIDTNLLPPLALRILRFVPVSSNRDKKIAEYIDNLNNKKSNRQEFFENYVIPLIRRFFNNSGALNEITRQVLEIFNNIEIQYDIKSCDFNFKLDGDIFDFEAERLCPLSFLSVLAANEFRIICMNPLLAYYYDKIFIKHWKYAVPHLFYEVTLLFLAHEIFHQNTSYWGRAARTNNDELEFPDIELVEIFTEFEKLIWYYSNLDLFDVIYRFRNYFPIFIPEYLKGIVPIFSLLEFPDIFGSKDVSRFLSGFCRCTDEASLLDSFIAFYRLLSKAYPDLIVKFDENNLINIINNEILNFFKLETKLIRKLKNFTDHIAITEELNYFIKKFKLEELGENIYNLLSLNYYIKRFNEKNYSDLIFYLYGILFCIIAVKYFIKSKSKKLLIRILINNMSINYIRLLNDPLSIFSKLGNVLVIETLKEEKKYSVKDYRDISALSAKAIFEKDYQKAIQLCKEGLKLAKEAGDELHIELLEDRLEMLTLIPGDPEQSIREYERKMREKAELEKSRLPVIKIPHAYHVFDEMINDLLQYNNEMEKWAADLDIKVHFPDGDRWEVFMKYINEIEEVYIKLYGKKQLDMIYREADFLYKRGRLIPPYYDRKNKSLIF